MTAAVHELVGGRDLRVVVLCALAQTDRAGLLRVVDALGEEQVRRVVAALDEDDAATAAKARADEEFAASLTAVPFHDLLRARLDALGWDATQLRRALHGATMLRPKLARVRALVEGREVPDAGWVVDLADVLGVTDVERRGWLASAARS